MSFQPAPVSCPPAHAEAAAAHRGAVRVDGVEVRARAVDAAEHERRRDVALVLEEAPLEQRHGRDDAGGAARLQEQQRRGVGVYAGQTIGDILSVMTVTRSLAWKRSSSSSEAMRRVMDSVSAAVPAPQQ